MGPGFFVIIDRRGLGRRFTAPLVSTKQYRTTYVVSPTESVCPLFSRISSTVIVDEYNHTLATALLKQQQANNANRVCLILEDCMYNTEWTKRSAIRQLISKSKELNILVILCQQYPIKLPICMRNSIDHVLITNTISDSKTRKKTYELYVKNVVCIEYDIFDETLDTQKYIVISSSSH